MMKTAKLFSFVIVLLLFGQGVKGQEYIPLLDSIKQWNVIAHNYYFGTWNTSSTFHFKIENDTLINGKTYKIIKKFPSYPGEQDVAYLREDTLNQKVFSIPKPYFSNEEKLLYDFSANVGDTVKIFTTNYALGEEQYVVISIDTIYLLNNQPRKVWNFGYVCPMNHPSAHLQWIEGIGSSRGPIFSGCIDFNLSALDNYTELLCYYEGNTHLYQNNRFDSCYFEYTSNIEKINIQSLKIFPNPVSDYLHIEAQLSELPTHITMTDITGRIVYQSSFSDRIDVSHLLDGIYLIIISCKEGAHYHHKIIKQK